MNYKQNRRKANWRRWEWNRIAGRITTKPKDAVVLYLPGAQDLDREVARAHGFDDRNLICVDRDPRIVKGLRRSGRLAIEANIFDVLHMWDSAVKPDIVILDLQCGLTHEVACGLTRAFSNDSLRWTAFAVNLLRGRDKYTTIIHPALAAQLQKHRGWGALLAGLWNMLEISITALSGANQQEWTEKFNGAIEELLASLVKWAQPAAFSYRSGPQIFDSLIFRNPLWSRVGFIEGWCRAMNNGEKSCGDEGVRRRIAATLAHRTMKFSN